MPGLPLEEEEKRKLRETSPPVLGSSPIGGVELEKEEVSRGRR